MQGFQIVVKDNVAPLVVSSLRDTVRPKVGKEFKYQLEAIDPDGDNLIFSWDNSLARVNFDSTTGKLTWIPTQEEVGLHRIVLKVGDEWGNEVEQILDLEVQQSGDFNNLPVVVSQPGQQAELGKLYRYEIGAYDDDGEPIHYSLSIQPEGMSIEDNLLTWIPTQLGYQSGLLEIIDASGGVTYQALDLYVYPQIGNRAPEIISNLSLRANADRIYRVDLEGYDPDGDILRWKLTNAPEGMVIEERTGVLVW